MHSTVAIFDGGRGHENTIPARDALIRESNMPRLNPVALAAAALTYSGAVLHRLRREYEHTDTFRPSTVGLLYGAYAATGAAVTVAARHRMWPLPLPKHGATAIGLTTATAGAALILAGIRRFDSPNQISGTDAGQLTTTGIYRQTRNPQYLGLAAVLIGNSIASRSGLATIISATTITMLTNWVSTEEDHLERIFGDQYRNYRTQVPRWIQHPKE